MDCFSDKMRSASDGDSPALTKRPNFASLLPSASAITLTISTSITRNKVDLLYYSMNQDSDKNENRRDGEPKRSFGRRDDGHPTHKPGDARSSGPRSNDSGRPRFSRDSRPTGSGDTDRPRRDNDRPSFNRDDKPRFDRNKRSGGSAGQGPRFGRSDRPTGAGPRRDNDPRSDRPRPNDRNRDERPGGSPFGSRDRNESSDRNKFDRSSGPSRPSFGRDRQDSDRNRDDKPRFGQDSKPHFERSGDKPRFERRDEKPRFERSADKPRFEGRDDSDRKRTSSDTPRPRPFDQDEKNTRRPDQARPRFSRDSNDRSRPGGASHGRSDKPAGFKRVGGFSREADDRNRENWSESGKRDSRSDRSEDRTPEGRTPDSGSRNTRFSPEQRKDSGERRTGFFVKAPNYELEQQRQRLNERTRSGPRDARPRTERSAPKGRPEARQRTNEPEEKPTRMPAGDPNTTRLNRYIANSGVCSRREADELISRGDITVNGKVVTEMGFRVKEGDMVKYGTKALTPERFVYVLLNKPKDYITTTEDPEERKTVMELVADAGNFRMYPVGRLDRKTTGLLLVTNDGELADKLTHPSNEVRKIYQVELDKPITEEHFDALKKGIDLEDGHIKPDALSIVTPDAYVVGIEIHSGRNRIVRRMFESLGYDVTKLDRTAYAGLTKKELPRGKWRFLDPKEVVKLKYLS